MGNQQETHELGWLAGIIDGEGWIGFTLPANAQGVMVQNRQGATVKVEIKINNTDPGIIEKAAEVFQKLGVNPYIRGNEPSGGQRKFFYEISTKHMASVEKILVPILPYLTGIKKERAKLMLRFIELRRIAPGVFNPAYANDAKGRHGPRTLRPYTTEEINLIEACRKLQLRGSSETTRETQDAFERLKRWNIRRQEKS